MTNPKEKYGKDTVVTVASLIVFVLQALIIIFGFIYRWEWLVYECAAMLIIPSVIILFYGIKGVIHANEMMSQEKEEQDGEY